MFLSMKYVQTMECLVKKNGMNSSAHLFPSPWELFKPPGVLQVLSMLCNLRVKTQTVTGYGKLNSKPLV